MENTDCFSLTCPTAAIDANQRGSLGVQPIDNVRKALQRSFDCSVWLCVFSWAMSGSSRGQGQSRS